MASNSTLYPLSRSFRASARLNLQHFLHRMDVGWLAHPSIDLNAQQSPKVLDVGAGTGRWLIELAEELPASATLDGFDVSDEQYPHDAWLPPNIRLTVQDILADLPNELTGNYDLVNIRYFMLVVQDNDPSRILQQAFKMLKPGGYLQWAEYDALNDSNFVAPGVSDVTWEALKIEIERQTGSSPARFQWLEQLVESMEQAGFTNVILEQKPVRKENWSLWQQSNLMVAEEMSYRAPDGEKIRKLIAKNQLEGLKGVFWNRPHLIWVAKKPTQ